MQSSAANEPLERAAGWWLFGIWLIEPDQGAAQEQAGGVVSTYGRELAESLLDAGLLQFPRISARRSSVEGMAEASPSERRLSAKARFS